MSGHSVWIGVTGTEYRSLIHSAFAPICDLSVHRWASQTVSTEPYQGTEDLSYEAVCMSRHKSSLLGSIEEDEAIRCVGMIVHVLSVAK